MLEKEYFVIDSNKEEDVDLRCFDELSAQNYAAGLKLGYLRSSTILVKSIEGLTVEQKVAIYKKMEEAMMKIKTITMEMEVRNVCNTNSVEKSHEESQSTDMED